jgi:hypothetical protein
VASPRTHWSPAGRPIGSSRLEGATPSPSPSPSPPPPSVAPTSGHVAGRFSLKCAVEAVRRPDDSSSSDGRPDFASEAYRPFTNVTSLKAYLYQSRGRAIRADHVIASEAKQSVSQRAYRPPGIYAFSAISEIASGRALALTVYRYVSRWRTIRRLRRFLSPCVTQDQESELDRPIGGQLYACFDGSQWWGRSTPSSISRVRSKTSSAR